MIHQIKLIRLLTEFLISTETVGDTACFRGRPRGLLGPVISSLSFLGRPRGRFGKGFCGFGLRGRPLFGGASPLGSLVTVPSSELSCPVKGDAAAVFVCGERVDVEAASRMWPVEGSSPVEEAEPGFGSV